MIDLELEFEDIGDPYDHWCWAPGRFGSTLRIPKTVLPQDFRDFTVDELVDFFKNGYPNQLKTAAGIPLDRIKSFRWGDATHGMQLRDRSYKRVQLHHQIRVDDRRTI